MADEETCEQDLGRCPRQERLRLSNGTEDEHSQDLREHPAWACPTGPSATLGLGQQTGTPGNASRRRQRVKFSFCRRHEMPPHTHRASSSLTAARSTSGGCFSTERRPVRRHECAEVPEERLEVRRHVLLGLPRPNTEFTRTPHHALGHSAVHARAILGTSGIRAGTSAMGAPQLPE